MLQFFQFLRIPICREIQLFDMYGMPVRFTILDIRQIILNRYYLLFVFAAVALFTAQDTYGYRADGMPLSVNIVLWIFCACCLITVYLSVFIFCLVIIPGDQKVRIFRPIPSIIAMAVTTPIVIALASIFFGVPFTFLDVFMYLPLNIILSYTFDTLCFVFVIPYIDRQYGLNLASAHECQKQKKIIIGGEEIDIASLYYAKSEEHYLKLFGEFGCIYPRARMADFVAQISLKDGIQTHRSWWVSHHAISEFKKGTPNDTVILHCGEKVPVARSRRREVRDIIGI